MTLSATSARSSPNVTLTTDTTLPAAGTELCETITKTATGYETIPVDITTTLTITQTITVTITLTRTRSAPTAQAETGPLSSTEAISYLNHTEVTTEVGPSAALITTSPVFQVTELLASTSNKTKCRYTKIHILVLSSKLPGSTMTKSLTVSIVSTITEIVDVPPKTLTPAALPPSVLPTRVEEKASDAESTNPVVTPTSTKHLNSTEHHKPQEPTTKPVATNTQENNPRPEGSAEIDPFIPSIKPNLASDPISFSINSWPKGPSSADVQTTEQASRVQTPNRVQSQQQSGSGKAIFSTQVNMQASLTTAVSGTAPDATHTFKPEANPIEIQQHSWSMLPIFSTVRESVRTVVPGTVSFLALSIDVFTPIGPSSFYVINGQTLAPGGPVITFSKSVLSLAPSGSKLVVGPTASFPNGQPFAPVTTTQLSPNPGLTLAAAHLTPVVVTIDNSIITLTPSASSLVFTPPAESSPITIFPSSSAFTLPNGAIISLAPVNPTSSAFSPVLIISSPGVLSAQRIALPVPSSPPLPSLNQAPKPILPDSLPVVIPSSQLVVVGGVTLSPGGPAATISGVPVSLGSGNSILVVSSSTITIAQTATGIGGYIYSGLEAGAALVTTAPKPTHPNSLALSVYSYP